MNVDVILPAGGRITGGFAAECGTDAKALIQIEGTTLLQRAGESARQSGFVRSMVVIGPESVRAVSESIEAEYIPEADSGPANIFLGLRRLGERKGASEHVMILTTDLPFLTRDSVSGFLVGCDPDADICLPIFSKSRFESQFPGSRNSYVRLRDGHWTAGCAYRIRREALERNRAHIDRLFAARKSALAMATALGPSFIARYLTRTLHVGYLENRCERMTGCSAVAIHDCDPALAYDIDDSEDYRFAVSVLTSLSPSEPVDQRSPRRLLPTDSADPAGRS